MAEGHLEAEADSEVEEADLVIEDLARCMMLLAVNAINNVKFHSGLQETGLFSAVNASKMKAAQILVQEEIDLLHQAQECLKSSSSRLIQSLTRF